MFLKSGSIVLDFDINLLKEVLDPLEKALMKVEEEIEQARHGSADLDSLGIFDRGEHIIGLAFTACQKYISSTFSQSGLKKENAIKLGPIHSSGESYACIINAAANYWKHCDEWNAITAIPSPDTQMMEIIIRDYERLGDHPKRTINTIEKTTSWASYTCSNVLAAIISSEKISVLALIPIMVEWRNTIISNNVPEKFR